MCIKGIYLLYITHTSNTFSCHPFYVVIISCHAIFISLSLCLSRYFMRRFLFSVSESVEAMNRLISVFVFLFWIHYCAWWIIHLKRLKGLLKVVIRRGRLLREGTRWGLLDVHFQTRHDILDIVVKVFPKANVRITWKYEIIGCSYKKLPSSAWQTSKRMLLR